MTSPNPRPYPYEDPHQPIDEPQLPIDQPVQPGEAADPRLSEPLPHYAADAPPLHDAGGPVDYDAAQSYDPEWTGQGEVAGHSGAVTQADLDRIEEILSSEHFRIRRRRAQDFVPPPPPKAAAKKGGAIGWAAGTFVLLVAASAFVAYQTTDRVPLLDGAADANGAMSRVASLLGSSAEPQPAAKEMRRPAAPPSPAAAAPAPAAPTAPAAKLVVNGASADTPERILVGVSAEGATGSMNAVIGGLMPGTTLSGGKPWGATGWIVPANELATTYLRPPAGFSGVMEYSVSLQLADNSVIDRQTMRLEWTAPEPQQAGQPAPSAPPAPSQTQARQLSSEEVSSMLARGEELLMEGDIASARLLLERAADAQDARAAFTLAGSYDPMELKRLGVYGAAADLNKARDWYEKARQYGSREAPRRLELLASQYR